MFKNIKNYLGVLVGVGTGAIAYAATSVHAAADADVLALTSGMASTTKDNLMGVLTANLPTIVIVGVAVLSIFFIWKLFRRFIGR